VTNALADDVPDAVAIIEALLAARDLSTARLPRLCERPCWLTVLELSHPDRLTPGSFGIRQPA